MFIAVFAVVLVAARCWPRHTTKPHILSPSEMHHFAAFALVIKAAASQDEETAKKHLQILVDRVGYAKANNMVAAYDNRWHQYRLYLLLSEITFDTKWKQSFLQNSRFPKATPVGDFEM